MLSLQVSETFLCCGLEMPSQVTRFTVFVSPLSEVIPVLPVVQDLKQLYHICFFGFLVILVWESTIAVNPS